MKSDSELLPTDCFPIKVRPVKVARSMDSYCDYVFSAEDVAKIIQAVVASTLKADGSHKNWLKQSHMFLELK